METKKSKNDPSSMFGCGQFEPYILLRQLADCTVPSMRPSQVRPLACLEKALIGLESIDRGAQSARLCRCAWLFFSSFFWRRAVSARRRKFAPRSCIHGLEHRNSSFCLRHTAGTICVTRISMVFSLPVCCSSLLRLACTRDYNTSTRVHMCTGRSIMVVQTPPYRRIHDNLAASCGRSLSTP